MNSIDDYDDDRKQSNDYYDYQMNIYDYFQGRKTRPKSRKSRTILF